MMPFEEKFRTLAIAEPTLQPYFGTGPYRVFDRQMPQKYIESGPCLTFRRVSTVPRMYAQTGIVNQSEPLVQFDIRVWGKVTPNAPEVARAAKAAVIAWLNTISFANTNNFDSPITTPPHSPNFLRNERSSLDYQLEPPAYVETFDYRIYNLEN